jgi:hypothetical protein
MPRYITQVQAYSPHQSRTVIYLGYKSDTERHKNQSTAGARSDRQTTAYIADDRCHRH